MNIVRSSFSPLLLSRLRAFAFIFSFLSKYICNRCLLKSELSYYKWKYERLCRQLVQSDVILMACRREYWLLLHMNSVVDDVVDDCVRQNCWISCTHTIGCFIFSLSTFSSAAICVGFRSCLFQPLGHFSKCQALIGANCSISVNSVTTKMNQIANGQQNSGNIQQFSIVDYTIFIALLGLSSIIGIYYGFMARNKQNNADEYLLGSKTMTLFPIAVSLIVSWVKQCY